MSKTQGCLSHDSCISAGHDQARHASGFFPADGGNQGPTSAPGSIAGNSIDARLDALIAKLSIGLAAASRLEQQTASLNWQLIAEDIASVSVDEIVDPPRVLRGERAV